MGNEEEGGIVEHIKLALDQASVEKVFHAIENASVNAQARIATVLEKGGRPDAALEKYVQRMRAQFERGLAGIHTNVIKNIIDLNEADLAVDNLVHRINTRLQQRIGQKFGADLKTAVRQQVLSVAQVNSRQTVQAKEAIQEAVLSPERSRLRASAEYRAWQEQVARHGPDHNPGPGPNETRDERTLRRNAALFSRRKEIVEEHYKATGMDADTDERDPRYADLIRRKFQELRMKEKARILEWVELQRHQDEADWRLKQSGLGGKPINQAVSTQDQKIAGRRVRAKLIDDEASGILAARAHARGVPSAELTENEEEQKMAREEAKRVINDKLKREHVKRRKAILEAQQELEARNLLAMQNMNASLDQQATRRKSREERELDEQDRIRRLELERAKMQGHTIRSGVIDADNIRPLGNAKRKSFWVDRNGNRRPIDDERWDAPLLGPELPRTVYKQGSSKAIHAIRQEIVGDTKIISDKADVIRAKIAGAFSVPAATVSAFKDKMDKLTRLYVVPDRAPLNSVQKSVIKMRAGAGADNNELQRRYEVEEKANQLRGARLTSLGRMIASFGVDARKADPMVAGLINRLKELNVSTGQLSNIMPTASGGFKMMGAGLLNLVKGFGLLYSVHSVINFFKEAIQASNENEVSFTRLSVALADVGVRYRAVAPEINAVFEKQGKLGVSYQQSAETLARLTQITGDFKKSLVALPIIQDIVASGYMTMEQASRAMGKAIIGDFGIFSRYGIVLNKNRDVLDQLAKRFGGELLQRAKTFTGQIATLSVQFNLMKIAMGDAFKQNNDGPNGISIIADMLETIRRYISENVVALKTLGGVITVIGIALLALFAGIGITVTTVINLFNSLGVVFYTMWRVTVPGLKHVWNDFLLVMVSGLEKVDKILSRLFGMKPDTGIKNWLENIKKARGEAKKDEKKAADEGKEMLDDVWTGKYSPKAQINSDGPLGNVGHITKEHAQRRQAIAQARILALSSRDNIAEQGKADTEKLKEEVNKRLEDERKDLREGETTNAEIKTLEAELVLLDKISEARDKMDNRRSAAERKYAEMISHLTAVAREKDSKASLEAVRLLNIEMDKLLHVRKQIESTVGGKGSVAWLNNEVKIKNAEAGISGRTSVQDELYNKELQRLSDMVDLDENRVKAVAHLNQLYDEAKSAMLFQENSLGRLVEGSDAYNATLDEAVKQRKRMRDIEVAMAKDDEGPNAKIDIFEKMLGNPETRASAIRDLEALERHLRVVVAASPKTTDAGRKIATDQADRIHGILETQPLNMKGQDKEITDAERLLKYGATKKKGLEQLIDLNSRIQDQLDNAKLTTEETNHLQSQQIRIQREIHAAGEPNMNMWEELKDFWDNDLNASLENVGANMADVFETAFTQIMRDSRNLGNALNSIPKGFAKAMLEEIANMAKGKARENLVWALEEGAKGLGMLASGNVPGATAAFASAAQHTAAAAAWGLLGGGAAGLGISASDAYANATGSAQGSRGSASDSAQGRGDIYLTIDGVDPNNPRHQRLVGETQRAYRERYGGNIIITGAGR